MARTQTLVSLRTQARQRADRENSAFVTDAEVTEFVNQSWAQLYEVVTESGEDYYLSQQTITTVPGQAAYALPADYYKTRGLDVAFGGTLVSARRFVFAERNLYQVPGYWMFGEPIAYAVWGGNLEFLPKPGGAFAVTHWYYPAPARMVADGDTIDGVAGWEEFAVLDSALKMLQKEGQSGEALGQSIKASRDEHLRRIRTMSASRDMGAAPRVSRTRYLRKTVPRWR